jgi:hypothetical protein
MFFKSGLAISLKWFQKSDVTYTVLVIYTKNLTKEEYNFKTPRTLYYFLKIHMSEEANYF